MPSKSNKNKLSLPTYPPPVETVCIPVNVPNDDRWIALFLGAIYRLTQQVWYDRDAARTAKLVAAVWQDIYLATIKATWDCEGGSGMFDLRVSPTDDCLVEKTLDGVVWTEAFRLDTDCALTRIIRNPDTGAYGWEVEDVGFYRFPDGPWGQSVVNPIAPPPTHSAATLPHCLAAANAAKVYVELYARVAAELLDQVATEFELAANLGTAISGFLMLIGAAATQPYVAIASILGLIGVRQQFINNPLDSTDENTLKCLLFNNASVNADGSVNFDFQAVWDGMNLPSPKTDLMRLLLTLLGPDALSYAGSIDYVTSANCNDCAQDWVVQPAGEGGTVIQYEGDGWWLLRSSVFTGNHKISMGFKLASNPSLYGCARIYDLEIAGGPYTFGQLTRRQMYSMNCGCGSTSSSRGSTGGVLNGTWPSPTGRGLFFGDMGSQFSVRIKLGPCVIP